MLESVVEDLAVKKALFAELDSVCKPGAILATNTSTLPVVEMAMATGRPDLVCGIHFFNPAPAMTLVEVVRPVTATDATMAAALEFATACGKDPVEVKDQAGFVVNALLFPYLNNAVRLLEQGVASKEGIDAAMKGGCGFPMGPFALLDLVGLDTSVAILDALYDEFRDPNYATVPLLRRMLTSGQLGRKTGPRLLRLQPLARPQPLVRRPVARHLVARPAGPAPDPTPEDTPRPGSRHNGGATAPQPGGDNDGPGHPTRCAVGHAYLLGPLHGQGLERAVPQQPGQGADRALHRLRPADPDRATTRTRPRRPARWGRSASRWHTGATWRS